MVTTQVNPLSMDQLHRHYLALEYCQSQIDGRNGSTACTVIAVSVAVAVLQNCLPVPCNDLSVLSQCGKGFIECMRQGNRLYDKSPAALGGHLLGVFDALHLVPTQVRVVKELGLRDSSDCVKHLPTFADDAARNGMMRVGVLVQTPWSVCVVVLCDGTDAMFDSHSHGEKGALILSSHASARPSWTAVAAAFASFVGQLRDVHLGLLDLIQ